MNRREFILSTSSIATISIAGCLGSDETVESMPHPTLGDDDAPAKIEVWEDFMCGGCATFKQNEFPQINTEQIETGNAQYIFRDYPVVDPELSWIVANAARSIQDRAGIDAFWEFTTLIYNNQTRIRDQTITEFAEEVGVTNPEEVLRESRNGKYDPVISANESEAIDNPNITGTPSVFINGEYIPQPNANAISSYINNTIVE